MQHKDLEQWIDSTSRKRRLDDFIEGACEITPPQGSKRLRRTRSDGDLPDLERQKPLKKEYHIQNPNSIAMALPSPSTSWAGAMPPPPVPPSRTPSVSRRDSTSAGSRRANAPGYRSHNLEANGVHLTYLEAPRDILDEVSRILEGNDQSTERKTVAEIEKLICGLISVPEEHIKKQLEPALFPSPASLDASETLCMNLGMPFSTKSIPEVKTFDGFGPPRPPITNPKPDVLYGYCKGALTKNQWDADTVIESNLGRQVSETSSGNFWGFLVVEVKSQATGCNVFQASNQAAGGGSTCTNATHQLLQLASELRSNANKETEDPPVTRMESITFSIAMDQETASLFVNYLGEPEEFYVHRVRTYVLHRPNEFMTLKGHVERILDWGLDQRLKRVREALDSIYDANLQAMRNQSHRRDI